MNIKELLLKSFTKEEFIDFVKKRTAAMFTAEVDADAERHKKMADFITQGKPFGCQTEIMLKLFSIYEGVDLTRSTRIEIKPGACFVFDRAAPVIALTKRRALRFTDDGIPYIGDRHELGQDYKKYYKPASDADVAKCVDSVLKSKWSWLPALLMDNSKVINVFYAIGKRLADEREQVVYKDDEYMYPMFWDLCNAEESRHVP